MKEITIKIPNEKLNLFLELAKKLGLEISDEFPDIPEEHKTIVRNRVKTENQNEMILWEEARKKFTYNKTKV